MKIFLAFALVALLQLNLYGESDTSKVTLTVTKFGDFFISNRELVHGTILRANYPESRGMNCSESDSMLTILDSKGRVLFTDRYALDGFSEVTLGADTMSFCGLGTLLACTFETSPNYGNCTTNLQLFGFNKSGELVPFTGLIPLCDGTTPQVRWVKSGRTKNPQGNEYHCPGGEEKLVPYLAVPHETGYCEVSTIDYYQMEPNGVRNTKEYGAAKLERQPILQMERQFDMVEQEEPAEATPALVWYARPDLSAAKKPVNLKKGHPVTLRYTTKTQANRWICVSINGVEGFLLLRELEKLGFEKCDSEESSSDGADF